MRKIFIFFMVVLTLVFLPILKVNAQTNEADSIIDYLDYDYIIEGIYYNENNGKYMWVLGSELHSETRVSISTEFDGYVVEIIKPFSDWLPNDIALIDPNSAYFNYWWYPSQYIHKLVEANYLFYEIRGGFNMPPVSTFLKVETIELGDYVEMYPYRRVDTIIGVIELFILEGYSEGYDKGYDVGYDVGYDYGYDLGYDLGYDNGDGDGYDRGYGKAISENLETGGISLMLKNVFMSVGSFLEIELLPGIPFGSIIAVPIVFGIIAFILGRRKE